jgi:hypothetical protein
MTHHPDFRAELQALLNAVHDLRIESGEPKHGAFRAALDRARTALAAPQQGAPTEEQILACRSWSSHGPALDSDLVDFGRQLLTRYGAQAVPVAVAKRLPGEGDCMANPRNGEGLWCWAWIQHDPSLFTGRWRMVRREWLAEEATHWLPHWALPLPEAQP